MSSADDVETHDPEFVAGRIQRLVNERAVDALKKIGGMARTIGRGCLESCVSWNVACPVSLLDLRSSLGSRSTM